MKQVTPVKVKFINEEDELRYYKTVFLDIDNTTYNYIKVLTGCNDQTDSVIKIPQDVLDKDNYTTKLITKQYEIPIEFKDRIDMFIQPDILIGYTNGLLGDEVIKSIGFYITNKIMKDITVSNDESIKGDFYKMISTTLTLSLYENDNLVQDVIKVKNIKMHYRTKILAGDTVFINNNKDKVLITNIVDIQDKVLTNDLKKTKGFFRIIPDENEVYKLGLTSTVPFYYLQNNTDLFNYINENKLTNIDVVDDDSIYNLYNIVNNTSFINDDDKQVQLLHVNIQKSTVNKVVLHLKVAYQLYTRITKLNKNIVTNNNIVVRDKDKPLLDMITLLLKVFYYLSLQDIRDLLLKSNLTTFMNYTEEEVQLIKLVKNSRYFIIIMNILTNLIDNHNIKQQQQ